MNKDFGMLSDVKDWPISFHFIPFNHFYVVRLGMRQELIRLGVSGRLHGRYNAWKYDHREHRWQVEILRIDWNMASRLLLSLGSIPKGSSVRDEIYFWSFDAQNRMQIMKILFFGLSPDTVIENHFCALRSCRSSPPLFSVEIFGRSTSPDSAPRSPQMDTNAWSPQSVRTDACGDLKNVENESLRGEETFEVQKIERRVFSIFSTVDETSHTIFSFFCQYYLIFKFYEYLYLFRSIVTGEGR